MRPEWPRARWEAAVKQQATAEGNKRYWELVLNVLVLTYKVQRCVESVCMYWELICGTYWKMSLSKDIARSAIN